MASNIIPKPYDPLVELLEDAADGAHTYEVAIGLKANKEADIRVDLEALVGKPAAGANPAVPGFKALWNTAKSNKTAMTAALQSLLGLSRTLVTACINSLKPVLGNQWNSAWNAAGFTGGSLQVPSNPMTLLQQLRSYYIANPAREVPNMNSVACTAVNCDAVAHNISDKQSASNQSNTDAGTAHANLEAGMDKARRRLSGLREELSQLISDEDERWYAFGLNRPSDPNTPETPENVVVTLGAVGSRMLFADWDDSRRADGYRVRVFNTATNQEVLNQLTQDSELTVANLPQGWNVTITVTARNAAGESQPALTGVFIVP